MTCLNRKLFHDLFVLLYISKKMNLDFSTIFCELNGDANLNGCELNREITVIATAVKYHQFFNR